MLSSEEWAKIRKKEIRQRLTIALLCFVAAFGLVIFGVLLPRAARASDAAIELMPAVGQPLILGNINDGTEEGEASAGEDFAAVPTQAPPREYKDWLVDVSDAYDAGLGNYKVINVSGFRPYVFAPDGAGSGTPSNVVSVTRLVELYGKSEHMVLALNAGIFYDSLASKVYCFSGKEADGMVIAGGTVLKSVETVDHTECVPLVIDEDGAVGWTDYYADADALARGEGYYYDIHGNKVTGKKIISAVCGFCPVVVDGKNLYDPDKPLYGYANYVNHYFGHWGRQVLGVKEDGSFVVLSVTTKSWSLNQAAQAALAHGCVFAYNLDGGFSIETVVSDFTGDTERIETLNKVNWSNMISSCIVFTDDSLAPVSAVPESIEVELKQDSFEAGVSLSDIAAGITVTETFSNANGRASSRRLYSALTFEADELEHSVVNIAGAIKRSSTSPGGNLVYTKTASETSSSLGMNDNSRFDGNYYDYSSGYSLSSRDDLNSPGEKIIHISYDPGGGWRELESDFTVMLK